MALSQPLIHAFNSRQIKARVPVDGLVIVADAAALAEGRFAADEAAVSRQRGVNELRYHEARGASSSWISLPPKHPCGRTW